MMATRTISIKIGAICSLNVIVLDVELLKLFLTKELIENTNIET